MLESIPKISSASWLTLINCKVKPRVESQHLWNRSHQPTLSFAPPGWVVRYNIHYLEAQDSELTSGGKLHFTCWEMANPMTTSSSRTSQVTMAELAFKSLTETLTGAEGLSARQKEGPGQREREEV